VKDVNNKIQGFVEKKQYLHATDLLVKSSRSSYLLMQISILHISIAAVLEGDLSSVEALKEVRSELSSKREVRSFLFIYSYNFVTFC
jgi:hypothetical protein